MNLICPTLSHPRVRLELLSIEHLLGLQAASDDGDLSTLWYTAVPSADGMAVEIERRLGLYAQGKMVPFTIIEITDAGETIIGMTTFMNAEYTRVEIGSTWYAQSAQRSGINTIVKRMMLAHAFEVWGAIAVEFRTHRLNQTSRSAIERLGAQFDGTLRAHSLSNGVLRDTVVYSIVAAEWPTIRVHLDFKMRPR
jgi:RimJ/RimL family protein N-acetyltransferase